MPAVLAKAIFWGFALWLIFRERGENPKLSWALWIPTLGAVILGSRPVSAWFGADTQAQSGDDYLEGSPFDRMIYLGLVAAAFVILMGRHLDWRAIFRRNKWLFVFCGYLGISCVWSDFPFVSFKRWIKDTGNVLMVLIVLSDRYPQAAMRAVLARCLFVLIPMSVMLIKYFPDLGRYYDRWTYQPFYSGVTTDKNLLGMTLFVCGVFLFWLILEHYRRQDKKKPSPWPFFLLAVMMFWLWTKAHSSTAVACSFLGAILLLGLKIPAVQRRLDRIGIYSAAGALVFMVLQATLNIAGMFVGLLGRDLTFTGRTEIWENLLSEKINPIMGVGFYSFWLGDRVEKLSEKYYYHLNEAHNGYLETYLNNGLIGVLLLLVLLISATKRISREAMKGDSFAALRLSIIVGSILYGMTEAIFNRLNLIWFALLLAVMEGNHRSTRTGMHQKSRQTDDFHAPENRPFVNSDKVFAPV